MKTFLLFSLTALAEIGGCYTVYAVLRQKQHSLWLLVGATSLAFFAWLLTLHPGNAAGRHYAAYGGVYIAASLGWLWAVEHQRPDRFDIAGALLCLAGAAVIILPQRA